MLLPQKKEREYRFRLALRMGLPIFALVLPLVFNTFVDNSISLSSSFYIEVTLIIAFSIYYIFYIIYSGFDSRVTDIVTKTFTREYLYSYLTKELSRKKDFTLVLISIENLPDINRQYGLKNGDKVLFKVAEWIGKYFELNNIHNIIFGHIKDGDFLIGLEDNKFKNSTLIEMMTLKMNEFRVEDIEVTISSTLTDTAFSNELEYMIENLFELKEIHKNINHTEDVINPNEMELVVIDALKYKQFVVLTQNIFSGDEVIAKECFVKLKGNNSKLIHPKSYMKVISRLGLLVAFDLMILERVILNFNKNSNFIYVLNISATSLRNPLFLSKLKEFFLEKVYIKNRIMFILSENEYYSHIERFNSIINSLHILGVKIAIDKLGNNHTSFLYLRELNIDVIRFDNFYSKEIESKKCQNIVEGFNFMAHCKGIKTWIKMINSEEIEQMVHIMGIDYKQGKYLADLEIFYESEELI